MAGQSLYSIGTYNVSGDTLDISDNIFGELEDALNAINNEMGNRIRELFGVELSIESFFTENKNDKYEHRFHTRENNVLELVKRSWNIDIYLEEVKKGYLYNSSRKSHSMKFYIKKHDTVLLSEEEESDFSLIKVKDTLGITKTLDNDAKKSQWEAYQALSPEDKKKLATQQTTGIQGAATASQAASPRKVIPLAGKSTPVETANKSTPGIVIDKKTLLPAVVAIPEGS